MKSSFNINLKFFDNIDTEAKAYFLGLMFADGFNIDNNRHYVIGINLQARDKHILETFRDLIIPDKNLFYIERNIINRQPQYSLNFHSKIVSKQLQLLGCVSNKSLILKFPQWLINLNNEDLLRHFIRGYFDGDGCISYRRNKRNKNTNNLNFSWCIISANDFCLEVQKILLNKLEINTFIFDKISGFTGKSNGITKSLSTGGNNKVYKIMKWLYKDATIYLLRKYNKFLKLEQQAKDIETIKINRKNKINKMISFYKDGKSVKYIVEQLKVSRRTVERRLKKANIGFGRSTKLVSKSP